MPLAPRPILHHWLRALTACVLALAAPAGAAPQPQVVTEAEAVRLALDCNRTLRAAHADVRASLFAWRSTGRLPATTFSVGYQGGTTNNSWAGTTRDTFASVQQNLPAVGVVGWSGRAASEAYAVSQAAERQARVTVLQNVRDAFYGLLVAQAQLDSARMSVETAAAIYDIADKKYRNGAAPHLDLVNAEIQRATAEQAVIQASAQVRQAQSVLAPLIGLASPGTLVADGRLDMPVVDLDLDRLAAAARAHHPQLDSARHAVAQTAAQVRAARAQANPSGQLFYLYDLTALGTRPVYAVGAQLQIPLDYGQIALSVRQQQATVDSKQAALEGAELSVEANVRAAWSTWTTAAELIAAYRARVLDPTEKVLEMTTFGYREGAIPYAQLLLAQQNMRTARSQYLTLLLNGHQALDALEAAVGAPLEEVGR